MTSSKCGAFFDPTLKGTAYLGLSGDPSNSATDDCALMMTIDNMVFNTDPVDTSPLGGVAMFSVFALTGENIIEAYMNKGMPNCIAAACIPSEQIPHGSRCWIPKGKCLIVYIIKVYVIEQICENT